MNYNNCCTDKLGMAEKSVLGSIMLDNDVLIHVKKILKIDDFYNPKHREIYRNMILMTDILEPIDLVTLSNKNINGVDMGYLQEVVEATPTTANLKHYAGIVKNNSTRRQYIKIAREIDNLAQNKDFESDIDLKSAIVSLVDSVTVGDKEKRISNVSDIHNAFLEDLGNKCDQGDSCYKKWGIGKISKDGKPLQDGWLDQATGGVRNELTYLTARPAVGKTTFAINTILNLVMQGLNVAFFSLEMNYKDIFGKMVSCIGNINHNKIKQPHTMSNEEFGKVAEASSIISSTNKIHIYDYINTIEEIKLECRELKAKGQLNFVVIDHIGLLQTSNTSKKSNYEVVSHISRQLKLLQMELAIPFLVLCQLNREGNEEPKLIHLRDSGSLEQDADNVLSLHSEEDKDKDKKPDFTKVILSILKQRNGIAHIKTKLRFFGSTNIFRAEPE